MFISYNSSAFIQRSPLTVHRLPVIIPQAVFGRPIPPKGSLEALQACTNDPKNGLKNGADNDPGVGAGGTAAAVERLALSISLLDRDVKIAHTLKDHRACLRSRMSMFRLPPSCCSCCDDMVFWCRPPSCLLIVLHSIHSTFVCLRVAHVDAFRRRDDLRLLRSLLLLEMLRTRSIFLTLVGINY